MDQGEDLASASIEDNIEYLVQKRKRKRRRKYRPLDHTAAPEEEASQSVSTSREMSEVDDMAEGEGNVAVGDHIYTDGQMSCPPSVSISVIESEFDAVSLSQPAREPTKVSVIESEPDATLVSSPKAEVELIKPVTPKEVCPWNQRPLQKHSRTYELEKFKKKKLLVFNHFKIAGYSDRVGTEHDVAALEETFGKLGFEVDVQPDKTKDQIIAKLDEFNDMDFTEYGCLAVAILTHGTDKGGLYASDGKKYSELDILKYFNVERRPSLVTKPKILIIQACRGTDSLAGIKLGKLEKIQTDYAAEPVEEYTLPMEADMLVLHSSYFDKQSHRHTEEGTWLIQTLCQKIDQLSSQCHLDTILREVKRSVAIEKEHYQLNRVTSEMDVNKQMPVVTSTLIRKLYLLKYGEKPLKRLYLVPVSGKDQIVTDAGISRMDSVGTPQPANSCLCHVDHLNYMKACLDYYIKTHPEDDVAKHMNCLADGLIQSDNQETKLHCLKTISSYLSKLAPDPSFLQFVYFYQSGSKIN